MKAFYSTRQSQSPSIRRLRQQGFILLHAFSSMPEIETHIQALFGASIFHNITDSLQVTDAIMPNNSFAFY